MRAAAALTVSVLFAAGCGGGNGKPKPIEGPAKEVAEVIQRFARATAARDFQTICTDLFAATVRDQAGGDDCPRLLERRAEGIRRPRIQIVSIAVQKDRARARVRTSATGQAAVDDEIRLVRESGTFRISSLGR